MDKPIEDSVNFLAARQLVVFWRIMHMMITRYGNNPMGQTLVVLTMVFLNDRGMPPTMSQLCEATGLPKASVSRYVSAQIRSGLVREMIDPDDRRRRLLVQTDKGQSEWRWQIEQLNRIFAETEVRLKQFENSNDDRDAEMLLARMKKTVDDMAKESVKAGKKAGISTSGET